MPPASTPGSDETASLARNGLRTLRERPLHGDGAIVTIQAEGGPEPIRVELPRVAVEMLVTMLGHLAEGQAVTLVSAQRPIGLVEVAALLNVSLAHVEALVEAGTLRALSGSASPRIDLEEVLAYKAQRDAVCREAADALTREAQDLGLGY